MKIVNYKKFTRGLFLVFLIVFFISLLFTNISFSYNEKNYKSIYVHSGETLWSIACNLQSNSYYNGKDVRYIINDIKSINNLTNSNLSVGDILIVPVL